MHTAAALLAAALLAAGPAGGQLYRWTDDDGDEHFTADLHQVPLEYRGAAKRAAESAPRGVVNRSAAADEDQAATLAAAADEAASDRRIGGRSEDEWRGAYHDLAGQIEGLEAEVAACGDSSLSPDAGRPIDGPRRPEPEAATGDACARSQFALDARRRQLERLEDRARRQDVPPGWLR